MALSQELAPLVECLGKFQTHNMDMAWLKSSWEGDHSQLDFLPLDFEAVHQDTDWSSVLHDTCREVRHFLGTKNNLAGKCKTPSSQVNAEVTTEEENPCESSDSGSEEGEASSFWVTLVEQGISFKGVVIVTGCLIERGSSRISQFPQCNVALQAACLYLCMICIPGSSAFRLFHPVLYQKAIDLLNLTKRFNRASIVTGSSSQNGGKRKRNPPKGTVYRKSRPGVGKNVAGEDHGGEHDDSAENRSIETEEEAFTFQQKKHLLSTLQQLIRDINMLLKSFTLKHDAQSLDHTILRLSELLYLEGKSQSGELGSLSKGIQACLMSLCAPLHGSVKVTVIAVMKRMFNMLMDNATHGIINAICQLITDVPNENALTGARILIQNICVKAPERADARHKASSVILVLLDRLPSPAFFSIVEWFLRFMQGSKVNSRVFALEIVALILGRKPSERPLANFPADKMHTISCQCLHAVIARCSDIAATVRSKALAILANCVTTENSLAYGAMLEIFAPGIVSLVKSPVLRVLTPADPSKNNTRLTVPEGQSSVSLANCSLNVVPISSVNIATTSNSRTSASQHEQSESSKEKSTEVGTESGNCSSPSNNYSSSLPTLQLVMELLRDRASDKKVHVRKAAVQVLQRAMELNPENMSTANIQTLQERCLDTSILVKKQSLQALTAILMSYPTREDLQQAWMHGILPSIVDPENSIQEKCVEMIDDVLLQNIVVHSQSNNPQNAMAWVIMNEIAHSESHLIKAWRFIQRAFFYMMRSGKLRKNLIPVLQSHINTENDAAAWLLLSGLAQCMDIKNSKFIFAYWDSYQNEIEKHSTTLTNVLKVMSAVCKHLDEATVTKYFTSLSALLEELSCPYTIIATLVDTISKLSDVNKSKKSKAVLHNVCGNVFKKCDKYLASVFLNEANKMKSIDEDSAIKHFTAMAEVAMVHPKLSSERICIILKSIIASKCSIPQASEDANNLGSQQTQSSQRLVKFGLGTLSQRMQNFALVTLGKLCLQNEKLAKDCTPALAKMLETSSDPVSRNNIVVILVDLCVRYTTMVDPYFPSVTACLKDQSFMVRNQTLTLLTHLLQEDYIKWRGSLFFCFVTALVDPSPVIRTFTEHAILHILTKRHPAMLFQHFVECLFFFNAYQDHEGYNNITQSEKEAKLFSLVGDKNADKRMTLYKFMLANMTDDHRFQVTAKLCQDILDGVVKNMIKLKRVNGSMCTKGQNLVRDTLAILSSDEIKLATLRNTPQDELEESDLAAVALATAKKTIVSQVVKKSVIENIVPILISLKHKLEKLHSPLLKDLMFYLKELIRGDYKAEVKEVLAADKQLSAEIEYDLKKFDQEQAAAEQEQRRCAAALARNTVTTNGRNDSALHAVAVENDVPEPIQPVTQKTSAQSGTPSKGRVELEASMLPVVQLDRLDRSILLKQSISIINDSKESLNEVMMADTVLNSPVPPRNIKRRLSSTSRTNLASKSQVTRANVAKPNTTIALDRIPILRLKPLDIQDIPGNANPPAVVPKAEPISPGRTAISSSPNTPVKPVLQCDLLRAISTPRGVITDITFRMASGNVSPIANTFPQDMLLHVMTPERASIQTQQWGVVPSAKCPVLTTVMESDEMNSSKKKNLTRLQQLLNKLHLKFKLKLEMTHLSVLSSS